jgi:hypothetical protein
MQEKSFSRRQMLCAVAGLGVAGAVNLTNIEQVVVAQSKSKTPPLTSGEMTAIEAALGKKESMLKRKPFIPFRCLVTI